jgi:DNA-binding NarL/FixJ family response regulator
MAIRVLIGDERPLVGAGLRGLLAPCADIEIIDTTQDGDDAIALADAHRPDAVVLGLRLHGMSSVELTRRLRARPCRPPVVLYAVDGDDAVLADAVLAGASAVLAEDASRVELTLAVRAAARGQAMLGASVARRLLDRFRERDRARTSAPLPPCTRLTPREREILLLTADGLASDDIARNLHIGVATVRTHVYRLRCKLQVRDRAELVSLAYRAGLAPAA